MISDLYLGTSRRTRPLPRGVAGHVAHPIRSIQILISENRKAFVIPAVNDRDRKIIRRAAAGTDARLGKVISIVARHGG